MDELDDWHNLKKNCHCLVVYSPYLSTQLIMILEHLNYTLTCAFMYLHVFLKINVFENKIPHRQGHRDLILLD